MDKLSKSEDRSYIKNNYEFRGGDVDTLAEELYKNIPDNREISFSKFVNGLFKPYSYCYYEQSIYVAGFDIKEVDLPANLIRANVKKIVVIVNEINAAECNHITKIIERTVRNNVSDTPDIIFYHWGAFENEKSEKRSVIKLNFVFLGMDELDINKKQKARNNQGTFYIKDQEEFDMIFNSAAPHKRPMKMEAPDIKVLSPREIYLLLSGKVFGQEDAKKSMSVILYQHLKRIEESRKGKELQKENAILIGPTGCGKTMIAKTLAGIADVPFIKVDATNFVGRGYRGGMHGWEIVNLLLAAAKGNKDIAKYGIVFIDEIDKLAYRDNYNDGDLSTQSIQQDLMTIIDGGDVYYEPDGSDYSKKKFSMKNVLFIFGGAFSSMCHIGVTNNDLVPFGFMPEFANRMGSITVMEYLSEEVIKMLVRRAVDEYSTYLPLTDGEKNAYTELIHLAIISERSHIDMGGRCVAPVVRRFFEERIFEIKGKYPINGYHNGSADKGKTGGEIL